MIIFFLISFITNIIGPLIPDIIKSFNLSLTAAGILPFSFFIAYGLFSLPSGYLIEFYGEKKIIIIGLLISLLGSLAMKLIWERMKIICEPSCAVPLAAILKTKEVFKNKNVGIILTGGNVDLKNLPF